MKKSTIYILKRVVNVQLIGYIRVTLYKHKLKTYLSGIHALNDTSDFAFSFKFFGVSMKPAQVKEEIPELLNIFGWA